MKLGNQQQEALDLILKFIKSKKLSFTLSGFAGTGKTFLTKVIIDGGIAERTIVQSFDPRSLIALHKMNTPFQLSYLIV